MTNPWGVDSESGVLKEVLLCPPDHFQWFAANSVAERTLRDGLVYDASVAHRQHAEMVDALQGVGIETPFAPRDPHLQYQAYTRDPAVMSPWGVFLGQMMRPQRRGEIVTSHRFYTDRGIPVWNWATAGSIEGGDIHLIRPGLAAIGVAEERTTTAAAEQLKAWLEKQDWEVMIVPFAGHFLHLDLLFATVNSRLALACEEVLDESFLTWLKERQIETIPVSYKDAMVLGCNCLALGNDTVLSAAESVEPNAKMRANGITVLDPELTMFTRAGGGPRCLSMPILREPYTG